MEIDNGRYRLIRRLGEGGTGVVYQAADVVLGRTVAVKGLHGSLTVDVLRREGHSLACLNHPNVVALYDVVESDVRPYLIMEYVDGCNLEQWLTERGPLPLMQALAMFRPIAFAIAEAHDRGLLHCDVKPANVLIATSGEVKLTDFTLAHHRVNGAFDGLQGGSLEYAAPEQARGEPVSSRTDIYALGKLLAAMIGPAADRDGDTALVRDVVARATALDPKGRFATVDDMIAALPPVAGSPTRVTPLSRTASLTRVAPGIPRDVPSPVRRRTGVLLPLLGLCVGLMVSIVAVFTHFTVLASPARVTVPDLVGTQTQSAELVVRSLALRYHVVQAYSASVPAGTIVSQQPMAGAQVALRGVVTLVVSLGPQPVTVPDVHTLSRDAAIRSLQSLGFRVAVQTEDSISNDAGTILGQDPAAGTQRIPGTTVTITVSTRPWWWIF